MRRNILVLWLALVLILASACGGGKRRREPESPAAVPTAPSAAATQVAPSPASTPATRATTSAPLRSTNTRAPAVPAVTSVPKHRAITFNDYVPKQTNYVDVLCIVVNFEGKPGRVFDLRQYWDRAFGLEDPIRQLNAYYNENFYGQLRLRPYTTPQMGEKGYVEVTLPGVPQDWSFGWLINYESPDVKSLDPDMVQKLTLENDKVPEVPAAPYTAWYNFNLALLNPAGNDQRDDLNKAALDAGETMAIDFRTLVPDKAVPVKITVTVIERNNEYATVHVVREYVR